MPLADPPSALAAPPARIFTIAPGSAFLATLADEFIAGRLIEGLYPLDDPLAMSSTTFFLPTRRAVKSFATVLSERAGGKTLLLPRLIALGDSSETEDTLLLHLAGSDPHSAIAGEADPLLRMLVLAQLIMAWKTAIQHHILTAKATGQPQAQEAPLSARHLAALQQEARPFVPATTPRDALALARALGHLIDTLSIHGKSFDDLAQQIPGELAEHWQITRDFLQIAVKAWPEFCAERGLQDSAQRRHRLLTQEAQRLTNTRPLHPMIVAGSTGSMPATTALIRAIATLPRGCVVLPGFDTGMDAQSFAHLVAGGEPGHPQHLLVRLVNALGTDRQSIPVLGSLTPALSGREALVREAMRPAATTHEWASAQDRLPPETLQSALADMALIEAEDEREEALAIALALREEMEQPDKTAALITPDRGLAERVMRELARWGLHVEDSSGLPLRRAPAGRLLLLLADWLARPTDLQRLAALIDHPLVLMGLSAEDKALGQASLDLLALRGLVPDPTLEGLAARLDNVKTERLSSTQLDLNRRGKPTAHVMLALLQKLRDDFAAHRATQSLLDQSLALERMLEPLCRTQDGANLFDQPAPRQTGLRELAVLFDDLHQLTEIDLKGESDDLPGFVEGLLQGRLIPPDPNAHPRLRIWGLLEARLLPADLMILGGCDEGIWPPVAEADAFLNRPMAKALGLPSPEHRLGQTAHDFCQALGAKRVILTRSNKRKGDPMVRSRFLQRLQAVIGEEHTKDLRRRGQVWLDWTRALDKPQQALPPATRPNPVPHPSLLPQRLSITEIATLRRDPYAIYARRILKLDPLDPIDRRVNASDIGTAVHDALALFTRKNPDSLPDDAYEALIAAGETYFAPLANEPEFAAFWWPNYVRIINWFLDFEHQQRLERPRIAVETGGRQKLVLSPDTVLELHGRADRIEQYPDGSFSIYDYKTGRAPTAKEVMARLESQLTVTAALVQQGGFEKIDARTLRLFDYIKLGGETGGSMVNLPQNIKDMALEDLVKTHWQGVMKLMQAHWIEGRGFASRLYPPKSDSFGLYDHLARVKEWALGEQEEA